MSEKPASQERPKRSRRRRLLFAAVTAFFAFVFAAAVGEFGARWYIEGSFLEAFDSVLGLRTAADPGDQPDLIPDEALGFKLNPGLDGVNSLGLRYPEDIVNKSKGTFRIVVVGDSVSFPLDGYVRFVDERVPERVEVINAAVHGYTTYQERMFLERDLVRLSPDLVLVQYCLNDNFRFLHYLTSKGTRLMTLEAKAALFPEGSGFVAWLSRTSYLVYGIRRAWYAETFEANSVPWENPLLKRAWDEASWVEQRHHFAAMKKSAAGVGARFVILAVPHEAQFDAELHGSDEERLLYPQTALAAICKREDVPFLDLFAPLFARRSESLFSDQLHLTPIGHRIVGEEVVRFLRERNLVPEK